MAKATGRIVVQPKAKRVAIQFGYDWANYYIWHVERAFKIKVGAPMHGPHVSLSLPKFDTHTDFAKAKRLYAGNKLTVDHGLDVRVGGQRKGFLNFFVEFRSDELFSICRDIGTSRRSNRFHITIANTKGRKQVDWWPEMTSIQA